MRSLDDFNWIKFKMFATTKNTDMMVLSSKHMSIRSISFGSLFSLLNSLPCAPLSCCPCDSH